MLLHLLNDLFEITIEIDGNLNKLHTRSITLQYKLEKVTSVSGS